MLKLIFGGIVLIFVLGCVFFLGFVLGTTVTPLAATENPTAAAHALASVIPHG